MEGIVVGIAQINFHQDLCDIMNEKRVPKESSTITSVCDSLYLESERSINDVSTASNTCSIEASVGKQWEEVETDNFGQSRISQTLAVRRQMPRRASKESVLGIKRRTIMKPTKRFTSHEDLQNLKPADIKKIYLDKKLTNFKPSCLETIFEETSSSHNNEKNYNRVMGGRKIKRSICFSNGFRYSKTLVNKRRAKIKKTFGKKFAIKKISLEEFIAKLNNSIEKIEDAPSDDSQLQNAENETGKEFLY